MEDNRIVDLYWARSEDAITETSEKYGKYCYSIAYNILSNAEDADESVNDTYLDAWHNMPPHRPSILSTFLGKITRRVSIDKWRDKNASLSKMDSSFCRCLCNIIFTLLCEKPNCSAIAEIGSRYQ